MKHRSDFASLGKREQGNGIEYFNVCYWSNIFG